MSEQTKVVQVPESALWDAVAALERSEKHVTGKQKSDAAQALRLAAAPQPAQTDGDTPLSTLMKEGSSTTSYVIGKVRELERELAAAKADLAYQTNARILDGKDFQNIRKITGLF